MVNIFGKRKGKESRLAQTQRRIAREIKKTSNFVCIVSDNLDHRIFCSEQVIEAFEMLSRNIKAEKIQIIVGGTNSLDEKWAPLTKLADQGKIQLWWIPEIMEMRYMCFDHKIYIEKSLRGEVVDKVWTFFRHHFDKIIETKQNFEEIKSRSHSMPS